MMVVMMLGMEQGRGRGVQGGVCEHDDGVCEHDGGDVAWYGARQRAGGCMWTQGRL
jgi:hypothetical protein